MADPVVTVDEVNGSTVVRWHHTAADVSARRPIVRASRHNASVRDDAAGEVPPSWMDDALRAHAMLAADPDADMSSWATSRDIPGRAGHP